MRLSKKGFQVFYYLHFVSNGNVKTPKSPEGDFKAAPLGEPARLHQSDGVWRGKTIAWLQFVSSTNKNLTFETASYLLRLIHLQTYKPSGFIKKSLIFAKYLIQSNNPIKLSAVTNPTNFFMSRKQREPFLVTF